jgi:hypothetical protein
VWRGWYASYIEKTIANRDLLGQYQTAEQITWHYSPDCLLHLPYKVMKVLIASYTGRLTPSADDELH